MKTLQGLKESPCTNHTLFNIPGGLPEYRVCAAHLGLGCECQTGWFHPACLDLSTRKQKRGWGWQCSQSMGNSERSLCRIRHQRKFNNLVVSMFTNEKSPFSQPAKLKGHAGEIRHLIPALAMVTWKKARECEAFAHMAECCHQLANCYSIIAEDDFSMKDSQKAEQCLKESMVHCMWSYNRYMMMLGTL
jgi:hypothetical protein